METLSQKNEYASTAALDARKAFYLNIVSPKPWKTQVREAVHGFDGMRVLDLGCANGSMLAYLCEPYPQATALGVDLSEGMIERAHAQNPNPDRYAFVAADATSFTTQEAFDRVLLLHILHLVDDQHALIRNALSLLAPGGKIVMTLHSSEDLPHFRAWNRWFEKETGFEYRAGRDRFTIETDNNFLDGISGSVQKTVVREQVRLAHPQPFVDYINTTRGRWNPAPTNEQWQRFLDRIESDIQTDIDVFGEFDEESVTAIITIDP